MTTINDIAKLANVSKATVSRVLNNNGYVSESLKQRVEKAIKGTGYIKNSHATSLRTKQTGLIGVVLPKISTETSSRVVSGINKVLAKNNFQILLADTMLQNCKEIDYIKLFQSHQVDGIILLATNQSKMLLDTIHNIKIPVVSLGQQLAGVTSITYNDYCAASDITKLLIEKSHKDIGFIGVYENDYAVGKLRKQGFIDTMKKYNLHINNSLITEGDFSINSGYKCMHHIITSSTKKPTAVFVVTDQMAVGAMQYLKENLFNIPTDIALASIGNSTMSQFITPSLTTVDYYSEKSGEKAAKLLLSKINNLQAPTLSVLDYRLIIRDSI